MGITCICAGCGVSFEVGYNGIGDREHPETLRCDHCAGVVRDQWGCAWDDQDRRDGQRLPEGGTGEWAFYRLVDGVAVLAEEVKGA